MTHNPARKEPVLEDTQDNDEDAPLLLTQLVRNGLPPQLWPHQETSEEQTPVKKLDPEPTPAAESFAMQWEEAPSPPRSISTDSEQRYAQGDAHWHTAEQPAKSTNHPDYIEDNDLEAALIRMSQGLAEFAATHVEPESAEHPLETIKRTPALDLASNALGDVHHPFPVDSHPERLPTDHSESTADRQNEPLTPPHQESVSVPSTMPPPPEPEPASEIPSSPQSQPIDIDFLKDFEQLLFQEIERRVLNEMEENVIQHLQTAWKEQVSLAMMRTLALEGIKLRESIAVEMRKTLPEVLQRVLHDGLDQIIPTETD